MWRRLPRPGGRGSAVHLDGPEDHMLGGGSLPGVLATVNFGSHARVAFETLRAFRSEGPLMCMEFWCGWFDHWGGEHVVRDAGDAGVRPAGDPRSAARRSTSHMAHGGTNFAGWAGRQPGGGALHEGPLEPDVTSYDYDAPDRRVRAPHGEVPGACARCSPSARRRPAARTRPHRPCWTTRPRRSLTGWAPLSSDAVLEAAAVRVRGSRPPSRSWTSTAVSSIRGDRAGTARPVSAHRARAAGPGGGLRRRGAGRGLMEGDEQLKAARRQGTRARGAVDVESLGEGQLRAPARGIEGDHRGSCCTSGSTCTTSRARGLRLDCSAGRRGGHCARRRCPRAALPGCYRGTVEVLGATGTPYSNCLGWTRGSSWV
ncbi:beta-galactosidase [Streptomyces sp. L7]